MDHENYWRAHRKAMGISAGADVARAALLAVGELISDKRRQQIEIQTELKVLRENPRMRGAHWTRATLDAEIARLERAERRFAEYIEEARALETPMQAELNRLSPMRESTGRLIDQLTADFEAAITAER
ncbi:MAG: hypothetical protein U1F26_01495 [Lysobacterales bacterium]